jgi:hypothetical protein
MDANTQLLTLGMSIIGSGIGTTIVSALFKRKFDKQIESHKALLLRGSKIHELQIKALQDLYEAFARTQSYLQLMSSSVKWEEEDPDSYPKKFTQAFVESRDFFAKTRLLLPEPLVQQMERFFGKLIVANHELAVAQHPTTPNGHAKANAFTEAKKIAYDEIPALLRAIEVDARALIHAETK